MIDKRVIDYMAAKAGTGLTELVEKDIILHRLLVELSRVEYFKQNYAFKGGTCLTKCYYGYYRFSGDLDFTFIRQEMFGSRSEKQKRRLVSSELDKVISLLEGIAAAADLEFVGDKGNKRYVELGGGNRFATFKLWYDSVILKSRQFLKIQINFVELLFYKTEEREAKSLVRVKDERELGFLFPGYTFLAESPKIKAYCIREVLLEKIRATLLRRGIKERDYLDVYIILRREGIALNDLREDALKKCRFMMKYVKYQRNIKEKTFEARISYRDAQRLLIQEVDMSVFPAFQKEFNPFLSEIRTSLFGGHDDS
jgi:predicted nucleotidyltransferase component of viral defense system